ncbi:hypothetical protein SERLADRAFT_402135, partial [Serpula lacrymans var. lacrymans S7.9]
MNLQDNDGNSPLHYAARSGHENVVSLLLSHCEIAPKLKNTKEQSPLCCAILGADQEQEPSNSVSASSQEAIVGLFLARDDIRVDLEGDNGITLIMLARSIEAVAVVELLQKCVTSSEFDSVDGVENCTRRINSAPL